MLGNVIGQCSRFSGFLAGDHFHNRRHAHSVLRKCAIQSGYDLRGLSDAFSMPTQGFGDIRVIPVSYTHLTLPTIYSV